MGKLEIQGDRLPIFISAGIIKTPADIDLIASDEILSSVTLGTYTKNERQITDQEFTWDEQTGKAYNRIQLDNPGISAVEKFLPEKLKKLASVGIDAVVSVGFAEDEDPLQVVPELAERAVDAGATKIELNISCPSIKSRYRHMAHHPDDVAEVVDLIRTRIGPQPALGVKPPNLPHSYIRDYASADLPIDFWTPTNTIRGYSGPGLNTLFRLNALDWVDLLREAGKHDVQVMSVGGVSGDIKGGHEVYDRKHNMDVFTVGIAQAAYRSPDIRATITEIAIGYVDADAGVEVAEER